MKNKILCLLLSVMLISNGELMAQNWTINGNNLASDSRLGSNNAFDLLFETNNIERGRITRAGLWGIGTQSPAATLHVNSAGVQDGFRVQINGSTKFTVKNNGGVSIGSSSTPPANGLFVLGNTGIGLVFPP